MSHRNARTTFHGRLLMVRRHQAGWPKAHIASAMGVSRKCVHTWISRFEADGEAGLIDRSSRPHTSPMRTAQRLENQIVAWRRRHVAARRKSARSWGCRLGQCPGYCTAVVRPTCGIAIR